MLPDHAIKPSQDTLATVDGFIDLICRVPWDITDLCRSVPVYDGYDGHGIPVVGVLWLWIEGQLYLLPLEVFDIPQNILAEAVGYASDPGLEYFESALYPPPGDPECLLHCDIAAGLTNPPGLFGNETGNPATALFVAAHIDNLLSMLNDLLVANLAMGMIVS